jgi:cyanate lyase
MSAPQISGFPKSRENVLADIGTALLQIKNARGLNLPDMADKLGRSDDQLARYIAGDMEMGVVAWMRAVDTWPELAEKVAETAAERSARARQRALDLELPTRKQVAA